MARAIVRYSFGSDDVPVRNSMRGGLEEAGFERIGTGSFEGTGSRSDLLDALASALTEARTAQVLDHLWIYVDEADEPG